VKFFEPIVSVTLPFLGLETIWPPPPPALVLVLLSLLLPQAAIPSTRTRARSAAKSAFTLNLLRLMLIRVIPPFSMT